MIRIPYITLCLLLIAAMAVSMGATGKQQTGPVLATVAGESIPAEEFRSRYIDYLLSTGLKDELRYRSHFLNTLIAERLLVQEARGKGIEREVAFEEATEQIRKKLLIEAYVQHVVYDQLEITEAELEETFVRANTTLHARHLFTSTKESAQTLYERLQQGETFEALAKEVFADTALANNGGAVGPFTIDEMDPAFEEAAFTLAVSEISKPVQTAQGFSIIQVTDRFTKPLITESEYATRRDKIMRFVSKRKKAVARKQLAGKLLDDLSPVFGQTALDRLWDQIKGRALPPVTEEEALKGEDETLVSFAVSEQQTSWTASDFREAARFTSEAQRGRVKTKEELVQFIQGLLVREEMVRQSLLMSLDRSDTFDLVYQQAERNWVWEETVERFSTAQQVPEDTLQKYFADFGDEFVVPSKVQVREILVASNAEAQQLKALLAHTPFAELASEHTLRPGGRDAGGNLGFLTRDQLGMLADKVFAATENDVLGPLEITGHYVLLQIGAREMGRQMTLSEARPEIESRLRADVVKRNMKQKINTLRADSDVEIDEELLAGLSLKKKDE